MSNEHCWVDQLQQHVQALSERPSWPVYFMATAILLSARSTCHRLHVGCVVVSDSNRIIASGYNGFLPGAPHESVVRDNHEQMTVHAEQNAITDAARRGVSTHHATAYITHFPCINCAKLLLAAGIQHCVYRENYQNDALVIQLFNEHNIPLEPFGYGS